MSLPIKQQHFISKIKQQLCKRARCIIKLYLELVRVIQVKKSLLTSSEPDEWSIFPSYLSSKRRKLTYEKMPGVESGQTKLVFKYDL